MTLKAKVAITVVGVLILCVSLLKNSAHPKIANYPVAIFLAYTNDSARGRLALFCFSNSTPSLIQRWGFYEIQFHSTTGWTEQGTQSFRKDEIQSLLRPNQSEVVAVSVPDTRSVWRLGFPYMQHGSFIGRLTGGALLKLEELGIPTKYERSKDLSYSNDIAP